MSAANKYIQPHLQKVFACTKQDNLILNPYKTTCTLFMQNLKIHNNALPMATHPKVMGHTLDPKLTYSTHTHNISVHKPLQIIKALTATGWGKQKETLMATYKAVMRPSLEYACCCLPTPMTLASGGSQMFTLVVHQPNLIKHHQFEHVEYD